MSKFFQLTIIASLILSCTSSAPTGNSSDAEKKSVETHIATFDDLDFNRFSHQDWDGFKHSHSEDVLVHWPDGHTTKGLKTHIEDLKYMFTYAPDTRIEEHPIKVGQGEWTAVYGIMLGTFTKPMKLPNGKVIPPTGKSFKLPMATFCHWTKDGTFDEEYLFWDNETYMRQLGLIN